MLRFLTAGESHGPCLVGIVEGLPAGLKVSEERLSSDLARRQGGYGRGDRMKIERDRAQLLAGVASGTTTGAPIAVLIENLDWANWKDKELPKLTVARPGHADLPGVQKYGLDDMRLVLERASARSTAMQVAIGALAKLLLAEFGIGIYSHVLSIGSIVAPSLDLDPAELHARAENSEVRCADPEISRAMCAEIDRAKARRDTVGGVFEVLAASVPPGLGSHVHWDRRLDGRLAQAVMSIQAIKGVEIGAGFAAAAQHGTAVHDELFLGEDKPRRSTNRAGGIEGGMSNGETIVVRAAMKPIATTLKPLRTIDLATKRETESRYQRSDFCAVPAASIVGEAMVAWPVAEALVEKFGGDNIVELKTNVAAYLASLAVT